MGAIARDPALLIATLLLGFIVFLAVFGSLIWRQDPLAIDIGATLEGPSGAHPMGTDSVGRDVFARFNEGAQISLAVGAISICVGGLIGGLIGLIGGSLGGWVDGLLMRIMDAILAFPPLILAMAVTVGLGAGLKTATIGIILTSIPYYARIIRADVLRVRSMSFIEAAYASGASRTRIIGRHIVPNTIVSLPILAAANFGYAILTLAALGFVGLGAQIPTPEWGAMITEGQQYILTGGWWIGLFPGLGILLVVTATGIMADSVRDILDPRGRLARA
jgi:peptide/nickel transport system permease protein